MGTKAHIAQNAKIQKKEDLLDNIASEMDVPVLYYKTAQYRNDILVAITQSYIPNVVPLKELRAMLKQPNAMIYDCLKQLGCNAVDCQENF